MRKLIVLLLFISFCGGTTEETVDQVETTTTSSTTTTTTSTTTTSTTTSSTTTTIPMVPPTVTITNCPENPIDDVIYSLNWEINSGSGFVSQINLLEEKNDGDFKSIYFTKEDNEDLITFPEAFTSNLYSYQVNNTNSKFKADYTIEISVYSEQPNGDVVFANDICNLKYNPFLLNPNTLLPKIKTLYIKDELTDTPKVVIEVEQGYPVDEKALSKYKAIVSVDFNVCEINSNKTISNNATNFEFCSGPGLASLSTWSPFFQSEDGSNFSYFEVELIDKYTVKYTLGLFKTELISTGDLDKLNENELFYQLSSIYLWNLFNYGNEGCDLRLTIYKTSYEITKSSRNVSCFNLESDKDPLYEYNLLEINNFNNFWNGKYFNGLPSFSLSNTSLNPTPTPSTTTTTILKDERSYCCFNTISGHNINVKRFSNSVTGEINGFRFYMTRNSSDISTREIYKGEISLLSTEGIYIRKNFEINRYIGEFEDTYSGSIGTNSISARADTTSISGKGRQDQINLNILFDEYSGNTPPEGLIIVLIDYFFSD